MRGNNSTGRQARAVLGGSPSSCRARLADQRASRAPAPEIVPGSVERSFGVGAQHVSRKLKAFGHDNRLPIRVFCAEKRSAITKFDNDDIYRWSDLPNQPGTNDGDQTTKWFEARLRQAYISPESRLLND